MPEYYMTHFYEVVRLRRPQIASEVVARGRNWNKVIRAKKFAQKRADITVSADYEAKREPT